MSVLQITNLRSTSVRIVCICCYSTQVVLVPCQQHVPINAPMNTYQIIIVKEHLNALYSNVMFQLVFTIHNVIL